MINENIAQGKWKELKGRIQQAWGDLTDNELEQTKGDMTTIAGMIQQKYGTAQEKVRQALNKLASGESSSK